jgi:hypothetical protein
MATTYKHSYTQANGEVATRTSTSRVYTHVVLATYGSVEQLDAVTPSYFEGKNREDRMAWNRKVAGQEVVLSWSGNERNALNAARAVKLNGYWVKARIDVCQMVEHTPKSRKAVL